MTERAPSRLSTRKDGPRPFASPRMARFLAQAGLVIGGLATIGSVAYAINGATQAKGQVVVAVEARPSAVLGASGTDRAGTAATVLVRAEDPNRAALRLDIPGVADGNWLEAHTDALILRSWDSTVTEQLLTRGGIAVLGLCIGVGAVLLRRLLLSIADGRPFEPGNAGRIAGMAGLVVVGSLASDILPDLGSSLVLERLGLAGPGSPLLHSITFSIAPLLAAPLLLALAEAFRRGTELAQDVEGLV